MKIPLQLDLAIMVSGQLRSPSSDLGVLPGLQGIKSYCSVWTAAGHQKTGVCAWYPLSGEQNPVPSVQSGTDANMRKVSILTPSQGVQCACS